MPRLDLGLVFSKLTDLAPFELSWWKDNIKFLSKYPINESPIGLVSGFSFASDSSSVGLYSYLVQGKECIAQRAFTEQERAESSTYRELLAFVET